MARWQSDPSDANALATLRRSFHTLKGSGRLVGALQVGDFAQAVEFLLNRLIETASRPSTQILDCIAEAVHVLPELVESEAEGRPFDIEPLVVRATRLREGIGAGGRRNPSHPSNSSRWSSPRLQRSGRQHPSRIASTTTACSPPMPSCSTSSAPRPWNT
ncbi:MAG: Hpt domain-containing protein [Chromatiales bacterium]|nr:Hpt domain-containing protein [Chromatiales bacterium]